MFGATYSFGEVLVDAEKLAVTIPIFKTVVVPKNEIRHLERLKVFSRILAQGMQGIRVIHSNPNLPTHIKIRLWKFEGFGQQLGSLGYHISA